MSLPELASPGRILEVRLLDRVEDGTLTPRGSGEPDGGTGGALGRGEA